MSYCSIGIGALEQCSGCDAGMYCPVPGATAPAGNCSNGYYCATNSSSAQPTDGTTGDECPVGHYCPAGTGQPLPCEDGTYAGVTTMANCDEVSPNSYAGFLSNFCHFRNSSSENFYICFKRLADHHIKGVMTRSIVDTLSELCSPFLKGGNSAFITAIASGLLSQTEYRSLEQLWPKWPK